MLRLEDRTASGLKQGAPEHLWAGGPVNGFHSDAADTLLFLRDPGKLATKKFLRAPDGGVTSESYGKAFLFQWAQVPIDGIDSLARVLEALSDQSEVFVVSGKVKPEHIGSPRIRRLLKDKRHPNGEIETPATIADAPSRIVHFDIDDLPVPAGHSWSNPEGMARAVWSEIAQRVPQLSGAAFIWQASSSAGTPGKEGLAKFHFWAMVETPLTDPQRRRLYKALGSDTALGGAVQANYTAAPLFVGVPDPLAGLPRFGVVRGRRDFIASAGLPVEPTEAEKRSATASRSDQGYIAPIRSDGTTPYGHAVLKGICRDILSAADGEKNRTLNSKAYQAALWVNGGEISDIEAWDAMSQAAIQVTGGVRWKEPLANGFRDGLASGKASTAPERDRLSAAIKETKQTQQRASSDPSTSAHVIPARPGGASGVVVCIGEQAGREISDAIGAEVWHVSNWSQADILSCLPADRPVVFAHDGLISETITGELVRVWVQNLLDRGGNVFVADRALASTPWKTALGSAMPGVDALTPDQRVGRPVAAPVAPAALSADEVGEKAADHIRRFFNDAGEGTQHLLKASLGTGKSHALRMVIKERVLENPGYRVLIRVPAHFLADEFVEALNAMGVPSGVWRGTDQEDPAAPGKQMCRRPLDLKAVRSAGGSVKSLCGSERSGVVCPFAGVCGYKAQDLRRVNVVVVAGDVSLSNALPKMIKRPDISVSVTDPETGEKKTKRVRPDVADFQAVVLDETTPTALLDGADKPDSVALPFLLESLTDLAALAEIEPTLLPWEADSAMLNMRAIHDVLMAQHNAGIPTVAADDFIRAEIDLETLKRVRSYLWDFRPSVAADAALIKGTPEDIAESLVEKSALLTVVMRCNRLIGAIIQGMEDAQRHGTQSAPMATIRLRSVQSEHGSYVAAACMTRSQINEAILQAGVLILDATPEPDLLRAWFPNLQMVGDLRAKDGDGVTRVQLVDSHMAYGAIAPKPGSADYQRQAKNTFRAGIVTKLFGNLLGGASSLIMPKASKEHIAHKFTDLAATIRLGHFGGVRGSNLHSDSRVQTTAGRQAPSVREAERMASVICGKPVMEIGADERGRVLFEQAPAALLMRDGTGCGVVNERHPDPMVEAVRRSITEAELDQAQGRARSVRRTANTPLLDIRLSDVASDMPVDVTWTSQDLKALGGFAGVLLASGVWPTGYGRSKAAVKAYRRAIEIWESADPAGLAGIPDQELLSLTEGKAVRDAIADRRKRNPALDRLVSSVDSAFESPDRLADVLGVKVRLADWHKVTITDQQEGRGSACAVMVQGATPSDAAVRAQALFPGCRVQGDGEQPQKRRLCAAEKRFRRGLTDHGFVPLSSREAARIMPDIWANHGAAKRDLAGLGEIESLLTINNGDPLYKTLYRKTPLFEGESDSISETPYFVAQYRCQPTPESPRPRRVDVIVLAETEAAARAVVEAKTGELAEFAVTHAPCSPDQERVDHGDTSVQVDIDLPELPPVAVSVKLRAITQAFRLRLPHPPPVPNPSLPEIAMPPAVTRLSLRIASIERDLRTARAKLESR